MLTATLIHPKILGALAGAGHGSKVLIAAANFPASTTRGPNAVVTSLALAPGVVSCTDVLSAVASVAVFEHAAVIRPPSGGGNDASEPAAWSEYRRILESVGRPLLIEPIDGGHFMDAVQSPALALTVATGDERLYTSILLTVGIVRPI